MNGERQADPIRTTILQNVVFHARFSGLPNISLGHLRIYVSRQDAKGAKVNNPAILLVFLAVLASWRENMSKGVKGSVLGFQY